jgi:hypothetical protein
MWTAEPIPDKDRLFMRVHPNNARDGVLNPGAFKNRGEPGKRAGMSTDWEKYSTPQETCDRATHHSAIYGIVSIIVGEVRKVPGQTVEHTPDYPTNRAHTDVFGDKSADPEVRVLLRRITTWEIPFPSQ